MHETTVYVWSLLGALLGTLLILAATLWAGKQVSLQARGFWRALRGYTSDVVTAVDESTDALITRLAHYTRISPALWAAFLPAFLQALTVGLDRGLATWPDTGPAADDLSSEATPRR